MIADRISHRGGRYEQAILIPFYTMVVVTLLRPQRIVNKAKRLREVLNVDEDGPP